MPFCLCWLMLLPICIMGHNAHLYCNIMFVENVITTLSMADVIVLEDQIYSVHREIKCFNEYPNRMRNLHAIIKGVLDCLYINNDLEYHKLVLPDFYCVQVLQMFHDGKGHQGTNRTICVRSTFIGTWCVILLPHM